MSKSKWLARRDVGGAGMPDLRARDLDRDGTRIRRDRERTWRR